MLSAIIHQFLTKPTTKLSIAILDDFRDHRRLVSVTCP